MRNQARMIKSSDGNKLAVVNPNAAGIDIADAEMQSVCAWRSGRWQQSLIRKFYQRFE